MENSKIIDARGLSCPQPAFLTHQALHKMAKGTLEVIVDSATARENVSRLAKNAGWTVTLKEETDGSTRIILQK